MITSQTERPKVVSRAEWLAARKELLIKEKQLTRQSDEIDRQRRELPWVRVEKDYAFEGPNGQQSLADLFQERSQLIVSHFKDGMEVGKRLVCQYPQVGMYKGSGNQEDAASYSCK